MRLISAVSILVTILFASVQATEFVRVADEVQFPVPGGWYVISDTTQFPFQLVYGDEAAEILFFRSEISPEEAIADEAALKSSVDEIIEDVVLSLPEAKLLTSTGFYDGKRIGFVLGFTSVDSVHQLTLRHRLQGVLYRHPEGYQILFTVWAKSSLALYDEIAASAQLVQDQFEYTGPCSANVFGTYTGRDYWPLFLIAGIVVALLLAFRPRSRFRKSFANSRETHFWRCECGRLNHINNDTCRRCGRRQTEAQVK